MHPYPPFSTVGDGTHFQFDPSLSHSMQDSFSDSWVLVDPALTHSQFEFAQKQLDHNYVSLQCPPASYPVASSQSPPYLGYAGQFSAWGRTVDPYRSVRYESPSGHVGGNMSESSSDYNFSPEMSRQQIAFSPSRYLSPLESHLSQQSWGTGNSFMLTPSAIPSNMDAPAVTMIEMDFEGALEPQLDLRDDAVRFPFPIHIPEELELSDSTATLTASSREHTSLSTRGSSDTDSSVSSPAQENDSDSDFDPKAKASKPNPGMRQIAHRSQRRTSSSSYPTLDANNRVHKAIVLRPGPTKDKTKPKPFPPHSTTSSSSSNAKTPRCYPCPFRAFGCYSTFANKNEWRRHTTSQHLQLGFYRCDLGSCNPDNTSMIHTRIAHGLSQVARGRGHNKRHSVSSTHTSRSESSTNDPRDHNDFGRKDLFTQHCRRMHGPARHLLDNTSLTNQAINTRLRAQGRKINGSGKPSFTKDDEALFEEELETIRTRCWTLRRHAPERSSCGFCGKLFEASTPVSAGDGEGKAEERAWDERMEHLGKHYERDGCDADLEHHDVDLMEWGLREGVLVEVDGVRTGAWLTGYELCRGGELVNGPDENTRREGLRKRGPRRKRDVGAVVATAASISSAGTARLVRVEHEREDQSESDEDAMAEDE